MESEKDNEYAYPTIEDFEELVGYKVNDTFKDGWRMARTRNSDLGITSPDKEEPADWQDALVDILDTEIRSFLDTYIGHRVTREKAAEMAAAVQRRVPQSSAEHLAVVPNPYEPNKLFTLITPFKSDAENLTRLSCKGPEHLKKVLIPREDGNLEYVPDNQTTNEND